MFIADATYHPTAPGEYSIGVNFDKKNVPQSPFKAQVTPKGGEKPTTDTAGAKPGANMPAGGPGGKTAPDVSKKPGPTEGPGAEGGPKGPGGEKGPDVSGVKVFGPGIEGILVVVSSCSLICAELSACPFCYVTWLSNDYF